MSLAETEYVAVVTEAIRRSVGVRMDETRLGIALAMIDEAEGRRARRARKSVATLRPLVGNEGLFGHNKDLSLTAAIPAFRFALAGRRVHVLFRGDDDSTRAMHRLYQKIAEELHLVNGVGLLTGRRPSDPLDDYRRDLLVNYHRPVTVGGLTRFRTAYLLLDHRRTKDCVAILRAPEHRKFAARHYKRLTAL